jgi:hypothetical protein
MILVYVWVILNQRKRIRMSNNNEIFCSISTFWGNFANTIKYPNTILFQLVDMHYSFGTLFAELSIRHLFSLHANGVMNSYVCNFHSKDILVSYLFVMDANRVMNSYVCNIHLKYILFSYVFVIDPNRVVNLYVSNIHWSIFFPFLFNCGRIFPCVWSPISPVWSLYQRQLCTFLVQFRRKCGRSRILGSASPRSHVGYIIFQIIKGEEVKWLLVWTVNSVQHLLDLS